MSKRVLIATGGTGGHIYPALGLAEELSDIIKDCSIHIAGHELEESPFLNKIAFPLHSISASRMHLKNPLRFMNGCYKISQGVSQSLQLLNELKPDCIVGFGSFYTFPILMAGLIKKVPLILHEGNAYPGKVNRLMSRFSHFTAVQFPEASTLLSGEKKEALLPLRQGLIRPELTQEAALSALNLNKGRFTILIFGGSQGAVYLNELLNTMIPTLKEMFSPIQMIHITGQNHNQCELLKESYKKAGLPHFVAPYHFDMGLLWKAADFAISRAGAATIREMIAFEVPSILIPFPYAADNHQEKNANFMATKVGGAFVALQHELTSSKLLKMFEKLFEHKMATYRAMKQALRSYKKRVERHSFAEMIKQEVEK